MPIKDDSVELPSGMALGFAVEEARIVMRAHGVELMITSGKEQSTKHSFASLHYLGCAVDIRTRHIDSRISRQLVAQEIRDRLNVDFDVILEDEGGTREHIHLEYQPKRRIAA